VPFINPTPYTTPAALRAITTGNNGDFAAGPGWNACTGLGSLDGGQIATLLGSATGSTPAS
jgi:kumamolisin